MAERSPRSCSVLPVCFGERESACGSVFTPRCSALDPESRSLHAFIYCVNGGERSRRNTADRDPTLCSGVLVSFPTRLLSSCILLFFSTHTLRVAVTHQWTWVILLRHGVHVLNPAAHGSLLEWQNMKAKCSKPYLGTSTVKMAQENSVFFCLWSPGSQSHW